MLKPSFSLLSTNRGKEKKEQLLMGWILPGLASCSKPSQSSVTAPSVSQPFPLPLLGPGRGEMQDPMRSEESCLQAQDLDVLLRCCWDLCLPKPLHPSRHGDSHTSTDAALPLGSGVWLGAGVGAIGMRLVGQQGRQCPAMAPLDTAGCRC